MDLAAWCSESRVWVVAGKGGVGKSTVAAALASAAAARGLSVLLVELEGKASAAAAWGKTEPLGYDAVQLAGPPTPAPGAIPQPLPAGTVWGRRLTPDDALLEYLADHGLQRVSNRLVSSGVLDVVATAIPGIRDVLVLGKVKQLERAAAADLIVIDAPATGHAMTFLTSASGLLDAARTGPVRTQAQEVVELLRDPARCRVLLVTLAEEMPVSETVEAAYQLEDRVGIHLGPVVVNGFEEGPPELGTTAADAARAAGVTLDDAVLAAVDAARTWRRERVELAASQVARLAAELPLPQLRLHRLLSPAIGPAERETLAHALAEAVDGLSGAPASPRAGSPATP